MYVAAPVVDRGKIVGVLSVGKPNSAMAPVIHRSERRILWAGGALLGIALLIGLVVAWWINRSIGTLSRYADAVTTDTPLPLPNPGSSELRKLAQALENMRIRLEGKNYIEHYVHALTHELKSPIAAIRGAAEILTEQPPPPVAARFIDNILVQNARMQSLVEKLLTQARLENRVEIVPVSVDIDTLFTRLADARSAVLTAKNITLTSQGASLCVAGDPELLEQALGNLLDNAIDFTPPGGAIALAACEAQTQVLLTVTDSGSGIPDYALTRIFERFYSLPRSNGLKSSGLGLAFVQEVARLHQGSITLRNRDQGGATATLALHRHFT
jgi:two-component system sensor histidine kinase CreC